MNIVERTCIVCKNKQDQSKMYRIVLNNDKIDVQNDKKLDGRGAYICKNNECVNLLMKNKCLNKTFKKNISLDDYTKIVNILKK